MHRARHLVLPLLALLLVPGAAAAAQTRAFVSTTDFSSGGLSAVNLDTRGVSADVASVHSDTFMRWHDGLLYVLNRFGQDNVQVIDPAQGYATVNQFTTGNGSNPADIAFLTPTKAYVSRYDATDLWIVNPATGAHTGSISLAAFADADGLPEMKYMYRVANKVFVAVQRLDRNAGFVPTDTSLVVVIDADADTVLDVNPIVPGRQGIVLDTENPFTEFAFDRSTTRLMVGTAGFFGTLDGGVEAIDPVNLQTLGLLVTEAELGGDMSDLVWRTGVHSYANVSDASFNTLLVSWNPATGMKIATVYAPGGFSIADVELNDRDELYAANNDFLGPGLFVFDAGPDTILAGPLDTGLPPFQITFDDESGQVLSAPLEGRSLALAQPWPNPARSASRIAFSLAEGAEVELAAFDVTGRRVRTLMNGFAAAGPHEMTWDVRDGAGRKLEAGVYWVRLSVGSVREARRLAVLP